MVVEESFRRLFPNRKFNYEVEEEYSLRLKDFNANIFVTPYKIRLRYNLQWKNINDEIKIGLVQSLLLRVFKIKDKSGISFLNIDLYNNFLKRIHEFVEVNKKDPHLEKSFNRVNNQFFSNAMDIPNLTWGRASTRKLACYNFQNNTVTVSTVFKDASQRVLDFLMYHELLHKHFKFEHNAGRASYHSTAFRKAERMYPDMLGVEKEIDVMLRKHKRNIPKKKKKFSLKDFFN